MPITSWSGERLANINTVSGQWDAEVAALANGGFVITWEDDSAPGTEEIKFRIFDAMGEAVTDELTYDAFNADSYRNPAITALSNGGFAIATEGLQGATVNLVQTVIYDAAGTETGQYELNYGNTSLFEPTVLQVGNEVWWASARGGNLNVQRMELDGSPVAGGSFNPVIDTSGTEEHPRATELANGNVVFVWEEGNTAQFNIVDDTGSDVLAGDVITSTGNLSSSPTVTALPNGGFVMTNIEYSLAFPASGYDVWARVYSDSGALYRTIFVNDSSTSGSQTQFATVSLDDGGFMVVWKDASAQSLFASTYSGTGLLREGPFVVSTVADGVASFDTLDADLLSDGRVIVTWNTPNSPLDTEGEGVLFKIIDPRNGNVTGSDDGETLYGSTGVDNIYGRFGDDTILGLAGADFIDGGGGADDMFGGEDSDTYVVDDFGDRVFEAVNEGTDTVESAVGFTLGSNLERLILLGPAQNGYGNAVSNTIVGTLGANILRGREGNDTIAGLGGNDVLVGGAGGDYLSGGKGVDTAYYVDATSGLNVSLANSAINTGIAAGDTYNSIENLTGTNFNDVLNGRAGGSDNEIRGGGGNDTLKGYSGNDRLLGGSGNDVLMGGLDDDLLVGGSGSDLFVFDSTLSAANNVDSISDFNVADDTIELEGAVFTAVVQPPGQLLSGYFKANAAGQATDANDRIIYDTDGGDLYYDADGDGATARIRFAVLDPGLALSYQDFQVA